MTRSSARSQILPPLLALVLALAALPLAARSAKSGAAPATGVDQIAFYRKDGLWVVRADGKGLRRVLRLPMASVYNPKLGRSPEYAPATAAPAWSEDGARICIGLSSQAALRVYDLAGRSLSQIPVRPHNPRRYKAHRQERDSVNYIQFQKVLWPRRNYLLAEYVEGDFPIYLMRWDGKKTHRVGTPGWRVRESTVSRDGRWLAYGEDQGGLDHEIGGRQNVFLHDLTTNRRQRVYSTTLYPALELSLAPDGSRISFRRWAGDSGEERQLDRSRMGIWTVNRKGELQQLTRDPHPFPDPTHTSPMWSPDGRWIAYVRGEDKPGDPEGLYLYDLRLGRSRFLYKNPGYTHTWESDSRHLIVEDGVNGLWRVSVPEGKAVRIVPDGFYPALRGGSKK